MSLKEIKHFEDTDQDWGFHILSRFGKYGLYNIHICYTWIHNSHILHIHSLNLLNILSLLLLKSPTALGIKDTEYLTVLDLGGGRGSRSATMPSSFNLSMCVLSCNMSISLSVVHLWYDVSMKSCIFPIPRPAFLINLSICCCPPLTHSLPNK